MQKQHNFIAIQIHCVSTLEFLLKNIDSEKNRAGTVQDIVNHLESNPPRLELEI